MTDPEKTQPGVAARYKEAEGWFDDVVLTLLKSPITLAAFAIWSIACFVIGALVS